MTDDKECQHPSPIITEAVRFCADCGTPLDEETLRFGRKMLKRPLREQTAPVGPLTADGFPPF